MIKFHWKHIAIALAILPFVVLVQLMFVEHARGVEAGAEIRTSANVESRRL